MEKSDSINLLTEALLKFHKEVGTVSKTATNPFFKKKYVPLDEILKVVSKPLIESGLVVVQMPDNKGLTTMLMHESGQWLSGKMEMMPVKDDPQAQGSAITYAKRYGLSAVLQLSTDEDDDGNAATDTDTPKTSNNSTTSKSDMPDCENCKTNESVMLSKFGNAKYYCTECKVNFDYAETVLSKKTTVDVNQDLLDSAMAKLYKAKTTKELMAVWNENKTLHSNKDFKEQFQEIKANFASSLQEKDAVELGDPGDLPF